MTKELLIIDYPTQKEAHACIKMLWDARGGRFPLLNRKDEWRDGDVYSTNCHEVNGGFRVIAFIVRTQEVHHEW